MGDRLNIIIEQGDGDPPVIVYSHSGGRTLLDSGIDRAFDNAAPRVGDSHYFTALFVRQLADDGLLSGIGTSLDDHQASHPVPVLWAQTGQRTNVTLEEARTMLRRLRT